MGNRDIWLFLVIGVAATPFIANAIVRWMRRPEKENTNATTGRRNDERKD